MHINQVHSFKMDVQYSKSNYISQFYYLSFPLSCAVVSNFSPFSGSRVGHSEAPLCPGAVLLQGTGQKGHASLHLCLCPQSQITRPVVTWASVLPSPYGWCLSSYFLAQFSELDVCQSDGSEMVSCFNLISPVASGAGASSSDCYLVSSPVNYLFLFFCCFHYLTDSGPLCSLGYERFICYLHYRLSSPRLWQVFLTLQSLGKSFNFWQSRLTPVCFYDLCFFCLKISFLPPSSFAFHIKVFNPTRINICVDWAGRILSKFPTRHLTFQQSSLIFFLFSPCVMSVPS